MTDTDRGTDEQHRPTSSEAATTGVGRRNFLEAVGIGTAGLVATSVAADIQSTVRIVAKTGSWNFNAITLQ